MALLEDMTTHQHNIAFRLLGRSSLTLGVQGLGMLHPKYLNGTPLEFRVWGFRGLGFSTLKEAVLTEPCIPEALRFQALSALRTSGSGVQGI